jgi:hypothetical protein
MKNLNKKGQTKYRINDEQLLKDVLFHDYQIINKMRAPDGNKIKMLSTLFSINPNCWRVVGITPAALEIFAENKYKKVPRMGINRSHIKQRHSFYQSLLDSKISNKHEFWEKYYNNDMTVLATSSENMKNDSSILDKSIHVPNDHRDLFRTSGYAWKHKEEEEVFLKEIHFKFKNKEPLKLLNQREIN